MDYEKHFDDSVCMSVTVAAPVSTADVHHALRTKMTVPHGRASVTFLRNVHEYTQGSATHFERPCYLRNVDLPEILTSIHGVALANRLRPHVLFPTIGNHVVTFDLYSEQSDTFPTTEVTLSVACPSVERAISQLETIRYFVEWGRREQRVNVQELRERLRTTNRVQHLFPHTHEYIAELPMKLETLTDHEFAIEQAARETSLQYGKALVRTATYVFAEAIRQVLRVPVTLGVPSAGEEPVIVSSEELAALTMHPEPDDLEDALSDELRRRFLRPLRGRISGHRWN